MGHTPTPDQNEVKVFFSYAHKDEGLRNELAKHLRLMKRRGVISTWHDREITAGSDWAQKINEQFEAANIILLLISADFLDSDYCWDVEMERAMERHEAGEAIVIPIILRAVAWSSAPFARLQALPQNAKPVTVWADQDEAFKNITDGIERAIGNLSSQVATDWNVRSQPRNSLQTEEDSEANLSPVNDLPQISVRLIGRDQKLTDIHNHLQNSNQSAIVALVGMPGVGKSELALHYAWSYGQRYPGGICWIDGREDDIAVQIIQFAQRFLGLTPPEDDNPIKQLSYCWQNWPNAPQPVLIIIDDIDSYKNQLKNCCRGLTPRFKFLLTSRRHLNSPVKSISLDPPTPEQAIAIFESILSEDLRLSNESDALLELCNWVGCLPLAIQLIGNHLLHIVPFDSIAETLEELQKNSLEDAAFENVEDAAQRSAKAAFELSWEQLSTEARCLGCLLSLFAPAPIPWALVVEAVADISDIGNLRSARSSLLRAHLLKQISRETVQVHRLLREFFRSKIQKIDPKDAFSCGVCRAVVAAARKIPDKPLKQDILAFNDVYLHAEEVAEQLSTTLADEEIPTTFISLVRYYQGQGRYQKARDWAEQGLTFCEKKFGKQHLFTVNAYKNAGLTALLQGQMDVALNWLREAFEFQIHFTGEDSLEVAAIQVLLAVAYREIGDLEVAERYATSALATRESHLQETDLNLAEARMTLATIQFRQGQDLLTIESLITQVLKVRRQELPSDHPELPEALDLLAKVYEKQERYIEAEPLYVEAKDINEHTLGVTHPQTAFSYNNLAKNYQVQQRYTEAEVLYCKAIEILRNAEVMPAAGWCLRNLAMLYVEMREFTRARCDLSNALDILCQHLPSEHPFVKQCEDDIQSL